jgi:hypothetical protein
MSAETVRLIYAILLTLVGILTFLYIIQPLPTIAFKPT